MQEKIYKGTFWRGNPQLKNGGYETTINIRAKSIASAKKKAREICEKQSYGSLTLTDIELVKS